MLTWGPDTLAALLAMGHFFPHLMFVGPHEHELYETLYCFLGSLGRSVTDSDVLVHECETNGGISAVRDVLRPFTRSPRHQRPTLVILRRFDRLSPDAQFALRRTMEIDQDKCRCLAVSTTTASVIQPLHSRFVVISCKTEEAAKSTATRLNTPPLLERLGCAADMAKAGAREANGYARGGVAASDVVGVLRAEAETKDEGWRLAVAAASTAKAVGDEGAGIYLIASLCKDWIEKRPFLCYAS